MGITKRSRAVLFGVRSNGVTSRTRPGFRKDGAVSQLTAQQVINQCFRELDSSSATCRAINRFPNGQIDFVDASSLNVAKTTATGLDLQADYSFDLPRSMALFDAASLRLAFIASWAFENETVAQPGQEGLDCLGKFGDLNFDYSLTDRLSLTLGINNLTDEEPPILGFSLAGDANVDISLYDVLGRRFFGGVRLRF